MRDEILKRELWDMTRNVTTAIQAILGPVMEMHGLTAMQGRVLSAVKDCEDVNIGTISKILDVCGSNASNMCKKLEKDGFIIRKRGKSDERIVELLLTEKGEDVLDKINNELGERYGTVLKDMDEEKFDSIIKGINALNELLKEFENVISMKH